MMHGRCRWPNVGREARLQPAQLIRVGEAADTVIVSELGAPQASPEHRWIAWILAAMAMSSRARFDDRDACNGRIVTD